jgi:hypothetical protein
MRTKSEVLLHSLFFSLLISLGIRLNLPMLLNTALSIFFLGILPPLVIYLIIYRILGKSPGLERWTPLAAGFVFGATLILFIFPSPVPILLTLAGIVLFSLLLERRSAFVRRVAVVILAGVVLFLPGDEELEGPRLLVLAIDAMDYDLVQDFTSDGQMNHISHLIATGAFGPLETEDPPFSPILWTTIASGRGREEHGIDGFYNTSEDVLVPRIWDILKRERWRIGMYRWLVTWPPEEDISGFWIPDFLGRDSRAVPPEYGVINEFRDLVKGKMIQGDRAIPLRDTARYGWAILRLGIRGSTLLSLGSSAVSHLGRILEDPIFRYTFLRRIEMEINGDLFLHLLRQFRPDFAAFYDNSIDMVGHRYWVVDHPDWKTIRGKGPKNYSPALPMIYGWTDRVIGRILAEISPATHVVLISDHGQMAMESTGEEDWIILGDRVLHDLGLDGDVYVATLGSSSYLFPVHAEDHGLVKDIVSRELHRIRMVDDDIPLMSVQVDSSSTVPYLELNRFDLTGRETVTLDGEFTSISRFVTRYFVKTGTHDRFGVMILIGSGIRPGVSLEGAKLRDIVPTLLHWEGLPVSKEMEGEVILDAFDSDREVHYVDTYPHEGINTEKGDVEIDLEVKERLRALGYVDGLE